MAKTQLEIAKENLKWYKKTNGNDFRCGQAEAHKQTCQDWLEFLQQPNLLGHSMIDEKLLNNIVEKGEDLKLTIKLYEEANTN